jgi:hypothetical protein
MTFSLTTLDITTYSQHNCTHQNMLFATLSIHDTQHTDTAYTSSVIMLSVIMLSAAILSVVAPFEVVHLFKTF